MFTTHVSEAYVDSVSLCIDHHLQGLTQAVVSNQEGINCLMDQGQKMRTVGATAMNETSSRSHSIFTIVVEINDVDEAGKDHIRVGKASSQTAQISEAKRVASVSTTTKFANDLQGAQD